MSENPASTADAPAADAPAVTPNASLFEVDVLPPDTGGDDQLVRVRYHNQAVFETRVPNAAERDRIAQLCRTIAAAVDAALQPILAQGEALAAAVDKHRAELAITVSRLTSEPANTDLMACTAPELAAKLDAAVVQALTDKAAASMQAADRLAALAAIQAVADGQTLENATDAVKDHPAVQAVQKLKADLVAARVESELFSKRLAAALLASSGDELPAAGTEIGDIVRACPTVQAVAALHASRQAATSGTLVKELSEQLQAAELRAVQAESAGFQFPGLVQGTAALCRYMELMEGAYQRAVSDNSIRDALLARSINDRRALQGAAPASPAVVHDVRRRRAEFLASPNAATLASLAGSLC